jgi:hypothetical protein
MGLAAAALVTRLSHLPGSRRPGARVAAALAIAALVAWPLVDLSAYAARQLAEGRSNREARDLLAVAGEDRTRLLVLDVGLKKPGFNDGGSYYQWIAFRREMTGGAWRAADLNQSGESGALVRGGPPRLLLAARPRQAAALRAAYDLRELGRFGRDDAAFLLYAGERRS